MVNLVQWQPFRELMSVRRDLDRLFDETLFSPTFSETGWNTPLVDLYQTDENVIVKATMPGVKAEDVDIQVSGNQVSLRGEVREEKGEEKANFLLRYHRYQSFSRTLTLPTAVVADDAKAEIKDGVLNLTLPKADEARPKVITVKTK